MIRARLLLDEPVGERRRCLAHESGEYFRLDISRDATRHQPKSGEIWWARVSKPVPGARGWFIELGAGPAAVIEPGKGVKLVEGALIPVRIKAEAWADKGPTASLDQLPASVRPPPQPGRHAEAADSFLDGVEIIETVTGAEARNEIEYAVEEALSTKASMPEGGQIHVEATRALTAVDVDVRHAGDKVPPADLIFSTNLQAAATAARAIALRRVAGLVVVDFISMRQADREAVIHRFRDQLRAYLGRVSEVLPLSSLGLCEVAIARREAPVADALGHDPVERHALDALRLIESEGWAEPGLRLRAKVSPAVADWLRRNPSLQDQLAARIGARWQIDATLPEGAPPEVSSIR